MITKLICPSCGKRFMIDCLCSNPAQYEGYCGGSCDFNIRWFQRKDPHALITQEELNDKFNNPIVKTIGTS